MKEIFLSKNQNTDGYQNMNNNIKKDSNKYLEKYKCISPDNGPVKQVKKEEKEQTLSERKFLEAKFEIEKDNHSASSHGSSQDGSKIVRTNSYPEPSSCLRIFFRFLMTIIPALMAYFCSSNMIAYISLASGFLAPPFVIIFPG